MEMIGAPPSGQYTAMALSNDGSTVVGDIYVTDGPLLPHFEAAIWLGGDQWRSLGYLPNTTPCGIYLTGAFDVSGDGSKVVGLAWIGQDCADSAHAFEWTEETGMVDMGSIAPDRASRANTISADGNVIAGWSDAPFGTRLGAKYTEGGGWQWITPDGATIQAGEVIGISSDGSILVGGGYQEYPSPPSPGAPMYEPWLWSEATGLIHLGTVKGLRGDIVDGQHYAHDVSDDGSVVVGQDTLFNLGEQWAFIWTRTGGIRMLQDYVRQYSDAATRAKLCTAQRGPFQPCSKWDLWNTAAISNDGKIIVGTGRNPAGNWEAFKVVLP
jgi:probable HAF family extracellular repeat protein